MLYALKVSNAQATVKTDREMILSDIAEHFVGDGERNSIDSSNNINALNVIIAFKKLLLIRLVSLIKILLVKEDQDKYR